MSERRLTARGAAAINERFLQYLDANQYAPLCLKTICADLGLAERAQRAAGGGDAPAERAGDEAGRAGKDVVAGRTEQVRAGERRGHGLHVDDEQHGVGLLHPGGRLREAVPRGDGDQHPGAGSDADQRLDERG